MKIYAYNPERETGYVYRIDCDDIIYERALQPFGGWDKEDEFGAGVDRFDDIVRELIDTGYTVGTDKHSVLEHCKWKLDEGERGASVLRIHICVRTLDEEREPDEVVYDASAYGIDAIGIKVPEEFFTDDEDSDFPTEFLRKHVPEAYAREDLHWVRHMWGEHALQHEDAKQIIMDALRSGQLHGEDIVPCKAHASFCIVGYCVTVWLGIDNNF